MRQIQSTTFVCVGSIVDWRKLATPVLSKFRSIISTRLDLASPISVSILLPSSLFPQRASIQSVPPKDWKRVGTKLLQLLRTPEVKASEYFRLLVLSLFTKNEHINHFARLHKMFQSSDAFVRREVILAARMNGALGKR